MKEAEQRFLDDLIKQHIVAAKEQRDLTAAYQGDAFRILIHLAHTYPRHRELLGRLWGDSLNVAYVNPAKTLIHYDLCKRLPTRFAKEHIILPLYELGGTVTVATPNPTDKAALTQIENLLDAFVSPVFAFPDQVETALEIAVQTDTGIESLLDNDMFRADRRETSISMDELKKLSGEQAVVDFSRSLVLFALKQRASDIHIEPLSEAIRVRFRIDGVLQQVMKLDLALLPIIVTRLKVMADVDISESRAPQDGRIEIELPDRSLDIRFSSAPTINGQKIVLRILGCSQFMDVPNLEELAFSRDTFRQVLKVINAPHGVFYVTGPTGSGKTTTLSAALKYRNQPEVNIITIEDPVEYSVEGVNQIQVNEPAGLTFASALRSFLRQDPDIVLVGEIRDLETAKITTQAALTGHLVLTTLHTSSALLAIARLLDLGLDASLLGPSILGVMAQRLVRRLCDACKEEYELSQEEIGEYFIWDEQTQVRAHRPKGCEKCNNTGYEGRLSIHEVFVFDEHARSLVAHAAGYDELANYAETWGFLPMRYDGIKKVLMGLTTFSEINRVLIED